MIIKNKQIIKKHAVIPVFIPHRGCPHDCIFCNQKKISGSSTEVTAEGVYKIIEEGLETIQPGTYIEVGFYGGSFTGIEKEKQLEFLETAGFFITKGKVSSIRLSTRPDYINPDILSYLEKNHVGTIELGVQSLDEDVLKSSNRGHSVGDVFKAVRLIKEYGFELGIQTMTGLPGDTDEKDIETAGTVISLGPSQVRIYPALVIKGTYMEKLYKDGCYRPQELNEAVSLCARLLHMYEAAGINVIRIGLQGNDSINKDSDVVAGPFHPAFRQLVETRLALGAIERKLNETVYTKDCNDTNGKKLIISTHFRNISNVTGQNRSNINFLKEKYGFREIKVVSHAEESDNYSANSSEISIEID